MESDLKLTHSLGEKASFFQAVTSKIPILIILENEEFCSNWFMVDEERFENIVNIQWFSIITEYITMTTLF